MTTAPENRGGMRPTAPQNNPANVSGTGGAGQSGQYTGFAYGENSKLNNSQVQGNAAVASVDAAAPATPTMPPLQTLTDNIGGKYSNITDGADFGSPVGSSAMPKNVSANTRPEENKAIVTQYLPDLIQAASYKDAPDSFKRFVNYLASQ
jgi:hypothetical protein